MILSGGDNKSWGSRQGTLEHGCLVCKVGRGRKKRTAAGANASALDDEGSGDEAHQPQQHCLTHRHQCHAGKDSWGINFCANTCGACIRTRANTGKSVWGTIFQIVCQVLEGFVSVRIHAAPVFATARTQENILEESFMYWFRARVHVEAYSENCLWWGRSNLIDPTECPKIGSPNRVSGHFVGFLSQDAWKEQNTEFTKFSSVRTPKIF